MASGLNYIKGDQTPWLYTSEHREISLFPEKLRTKSGAESRLKPALQNLNPNA